MAQQAGTGVGYNTGHGIEPGHRGLCPGMTVEHRDGINNGSDIHEDVDAKRQRISNITVFHVE